MRSVPALSELPSGQNLLVRVAVGAVVISADGAVLGHLSGEGSTDPVDTGSQRSSGPEPVVPADCSVDEALGSGQYRLFCEDPDGQSTPTVEILVDDERVIVAAIPDPPQEIAERASGSSLFHGGFRAIWPKPGLRGGGALAQMQVECELAVAVWVDEIGQVTHLDGSDWWGDSWPPGTSTALGWVGDEGIVWLTDSPCAADGADSGVYAVSQDGTRRLLYPTDGRTIDVAMSQ